MKGLHGQNAIVTGGASGIGRAICLALGAQGCNVGVFDINLEGGIISFTKTLARLPNTS